MTSSRCGLQVCSGSRSPGPRWQLTADEARNVGGIVREVRIHLTDCGDIRLYGEPHPVYVRSARPRVPVRWSTETRPPEPAAIVSASCPCRPANRRPRRARRHPGCAERTNKRIQVVALVVRRNDDKSSRSRVLTEVEKRRDETCSDTSPTSSTSAASRISGTAPFGDPPVRRRSRRRTVPTRNATRLIGTKTRGRLNTVTIFSNIQQEPRAVASSRSSNGRCAVVRLSSNTTLYPARMNASVVVVGVEKPLAAGA